MERIFFLRSTKDYSNEKVTQRHVDRVMVYEQPTNSIQVK